MIYLDTETKSDVPIKSGTNAYVNGEHFEVLIVTYAFDDEPVRLWQPCRGESAPRRLREAVAGARRWSSTTARSTGAC